MKKIGVFIILFAMMGYSTTTVLASEAPVKINDGNVRIVNLGEVLQPMEYPRIELHNLQGLLTPEEREFLAKTKPGQSNFASAVVAELEKMDDTALLTVFLREGYTYTFQEMAEELAALFGAGLNLTESRDDGLHRLSLTKSQLLAIEYMEEIAMVFNEDMMEVLTTSGAGDQTLKTAKGSSLPASAFTGAQNARQEYNISGSLDGGENNYSKNDVVIAVIDTGINANHELLKGKVIGWYDAVCPSNTIPGDYGSGVDAGHGTAVASVVSEYAPGASIVAVRAKGGSESNMFHMMIALDWLINYGLDQYHIDAVVFSMETPYTSTCIRETVSMMNRLDAMGVPVFVSAGNSGPGRDSIRQNTYAQNARYAIGNVKDPLNGGWGISSTSGRGGQLQGPLFCMPGTNIRVADASSDTDTKIVSGTSFAAPAAAGSFALLLDAARQTENNTVVLKTLPLGLAGKDPYYGYGVLDVYASVQAMKDGGGNFDSGYFTAAAAYSADNGQAVLFEIEAARDTLLNTTFLTREVTGNADGNFVIVYNTKEDFNQTGALYWLTDNGSGWRQQGAGGIPLKQGINYIGIYNLDTADSAQYFTMDICGPKEDIVMAWGN